MRIGLVIYGSLDTLSGGYLYDRKLVEYLYEQGDDVEIISLSWRNYAAHMIDNLYFRLPSPKVTRSGVRAERRIKTKVDAVVKKSSDDLSLDILIQDELNHPSLIAANMGKHPYPVISLVHHLRSSEHRPGWQNAFYRVIERKYLESVDGLIFNSKTTKNVVHQLIENSKPHIVAYPPTDRFGAPISEEEIIGRSKTNPLRILFLGNLIERKGLHTLLDALSFQRGMTFLLDVVGSLSAEPKYAKAIQEKIQSLGFSSLVSLHGPLDREPLMAKLRQGHVLAVPSTYEGYGIVYLEGMCFGLPAIGTTAGAAGEIISAGVDGFLIAPGDARSLAYWLKVLDEKREVLIRMSLAARERYLRQPKWEQTANQIREFLLKQIREFSV